MSTLQPILMIMAAIVIGSKSTPHQLRIPRMPKYVVGQQYNQSVLVIPVQIDRTHPDAIMTVKKLFRNRKHTAPMQSSVPSTDCQVSEGMFSIRSRKTPSSWNTDASNSGLGASVSDSL